MTLLASVLDATLLLGLSLVIVALLRRHSAARRHAVLAAAIVVAAATPAFEQWLPSVPIGAWPSSASVTTSGATWAGGETVGVAGVVDASEAAQTGSWPELLVGVWLLGTLASAAGLATGLLRLRRIARGSLPADRRWRTQADAIAHAWSIRRPVRLLQSRHPSLLVSYGVLRPTIVLPAGAAGWSDDRIRAVLLHEIAHVRRMDAVTQLVAESLRAVLWFNPVVWLACRALRHESECACDDAVLREQVGPTDYATHLLEVARAATHPRYVYALASAIAHPSTLERRISAVLNSQRPRTALTRRARLTTAAAVLAIAVPLTAAGLAPASPAGVREAISTDVALVPSPAAAAPQASPATPPAARPVTRAPKAAASQSPNVPAVSPGAVSGTVLDQSGAVLPGVALTLTDTQFGAQLTTVTNASGRFAFREVVPSRYELRSALPGFAPVAIVLPVSPGSTVTRSFMLPVGTLSERIIVVCSTAGTPTPGPRVASASGWRDLHDRLFAHVHYLARWIASAFAPSLSAQTGLPVRVGGQLRAPRKVADVKPVCPAASLPGNEVTVDLTGRIGIDGQLVDLRPSGSNDIPAAVTDAALDAVRQWRFTQTLLNGEPVEVSLSIVVVFKR